MLYIVYLRSRNGTQIQQYRPSGCNYVRYVLPRDYTKNEARVTKFGIHNDLEEPSYGIDFKSKNANGLEVSRVRHITLYTFTRC